MKTIKSLLILLILVNLSCNSDNDSAKNTNAIAGDWFLHSVKGGSDNFDDSLIDFEVKWLIKNNGTVVVENNNSLEDVNTFLPSGTYTYSYSENADAGECNGTFTINNIVFDCWNTTETQGTILTQSSENGYQLFINRIPEEL